MAGVIENVRKTLTHAIIARTTSTTTCASLRIIHIADASRLAQSHLLQCQAKNNNQAHQHAPAAKL